MKNQFLKLLILFALSQALFSCSDNNGIRYNKEEYAKFIADMRARASQKGVSDATIHEAFDNAQFIPNVVVLDRKQPERKKGPGFANYKARTVTPERIARAREKLKENYMILTDIEKRFGVQKEILVSLWAVESSFGEVMGKYDLVDSLSSLAYEGRRQEFFATELMNCLTILDQRHIDKANFKGSWAGAFGQVQFMPSTFLKYAYDYDGDGRKDIWYNNGDALASAANYLSSIGWQRSAPWGKKVKLPAGFNSKYLGKEITMPLSSWRKMGVKYANGEPLANSPTVDASVIGLDYDYDKTNVYIVFDNYKKILNWNNSVYFATSIGLIADRLK